MSAAPREFPLAPLSPLAWLGMVVPALLVVACMLWLQPPAELPSLVWLTMPLFVLAVIAALLLALKRRRIVLEDRELVVAATIYTRRIALASLDLEQARVIDLGERTEFRPMVKTNGFGVPRFRAGHFRLRNAKKAFCLLTDQERVLVLPLHDGTFILLSPEKPQVLLQALRGAA